MDGWMSYVLLTVLVFSVNDLYDLPPAQNKLSSFKKHLTVILT